MNWITDSLIRIKNASAIGKESALVIGNKFCLNIFEVLKKEGFIKDYIVSDAQKNSYRILLSYYKNIPLIKNIKFISTPSNRVYNSSASFKKYIRDFKFLMVSTDKGVMSAKDAIDLNLGGEVLFWIGN